MNKRMVSLFIGALFILILTGCSALREQSTNAEPSEQVYPVEIAPVEKGKVNDELIIAGDITAIKEVTVVSKLTGKIERIYVKKGDWVEKGQRLAQLDQSDILNNVKQAEAALQSAQANLANAKASRESGIIQAQQNLKNAQLAYENAKINYERMRVLYDQGAISKQQFEQAETGLKQAEASLNMAQESLNSANRTENIKTLEAAVKQAEVGLQIARDQLANTVIEAPITGQVVMIGSDEGEFTSPQAPFMTMMQTKPLIVKANISEDQLIYVKEGQQLEIQVKSVGKTLSGTVRFVSPVTSSQSRSYPIEIEVQEAPEVVKPGMIAEILLNKLSESKEQILVPIDAVIMSEGKSYVFVVNNDRAEKREVTTGKENGQFVVIEGGLTEGEQIVIKGQYTLKDGYAVRVTGGK
ncbi:efflux RND transporter periplasmic adaptor subunit [Microaerobacter geothermalis]|uniref:efflux RND transporter periplasmic adaptor subunit n=1 Tax=Microaerobacter geothermalis TaxID=674972 RepID=UPI001F1D406C|nr:efflux RND transporter periplasmic adaptor subunit [Microaerobacter geothermalis]MCF6093630.1 efflux RND transporter periplasmic adaptor subunit [Microaerobacter geothermalis]